MKSPKWNELFKLQFQMLSYPHHLIHLEPKLLLKYAISRYENVNKIKAICDEGDALF